MARVDQKFPWKLRRRVVFGTLGYCAFWIGYLILYGVQDSRLHQDTVNGLLLLAGSTIGSYVFGAVWDDRERRRAPSLDDIDPPKDEST